MWCPIVVFERAVRTQECIYFLFLPQISAVTQEFERKSCTYEEFLPQIEAYLSAQWSAMNDLKAKLSDFKALVAEEGR